jgi:S1-C subfamily serine protease
MVSEPVIAIGNAFSYEHTVSTESSTRQRDVTLNHEISYKSLIQTDACINPGNSGGPCSTFTASGRHQRGDPPAQNHFRDSVDSMLPSQPVC